MTCKAGHAPRVRRDATDATAERLIKLLEEIDWLRSPGAFSLRYRQASGTNEYHLAEARAYVRGLLVGLVSQPFTDEDLTR